MTATSIRYRSRVGVNWAALFVGIGAGLTVATQVTVVRASDFGGVYQWMTTLSRTAALLGTYFAIIGLFLVARIPFVEQAIGHDRLVVWHRTLGPWSLYLITLHVTLLVLGFAGVDGIPLYKEVWNLIQDFEWIWGALIGFVFFIAAGITSYKKARAKMSYETWWTIHVLTYIGVAASFLHQIKNGQMFINHPLAKAYWIFVYALMGAALLIWRFIVPWVKAFRMNLVVERIVEEGPGVHSVIMKGRNLDTLGGEGGQFFNWRFLTPGHILVAHPYSLSAAPTKTHLRITVKDLGDHSNAVRNIKRGTHVLAEGPYGAFAAGFARRPYIVMIGGGVGITPLRALIEEFKGRVEIDVLFRASKVEDLVLKNELDYLAENSEGKIRIQYLVGSRKNHPMSALSLKKLLPNIDQAEIYMCGPEGMIEAVKEAAEEIGIPKERVHDEAFVYHKE